ncbi:hypothetical protein [Alkalicoccobacillus murimartini]|uniref:LXG domain-containing protein n=1 Tax=Alkalicoccobacillus murimartini TaxID=171685 RepID=A0ABT9YGX5_9BACI|nr:hypothetical protein [Alkalicoccobacillus murimartini]MDQ0206949.1 hypothetical protein [Alkalicoccobacillus murimartini]
MGNHKADKEELNRLIQEYQQTIDDYVQNMHLAQTISARMNHKYTLQDYVDPVTEAKDDIKAVRDYWDGMVEADTNAKNNYSNARTGLSFFNINVTQFLEALGKGGENIESICVETLTESVMKDGILTTQLIGKMGSGQPLSYSERELLNQYIQKEVLTDEVREEAKEISRMVSEEGTEDLKKRINDEVLVSEELLDQEIGIIEAYLYGHYLNPGDLTSNEEVVKLRAYLAILNNYKKAIDEVNNELEMNGSEPIGGEGVPLYASVDEISYDLVENPYSHRLNSDIRISITQYDESEMSRDDFINMEFPILVRLNESEVIYFAGNRSSVNNQNEQNNVYAEELANYNANFFSEKASQLILANVAKGAYTPMDMVVSYQSGKNDLEKNITVGEARAVADDLEMQLLVSKRDVPGAGRNDFQVSLYPRDSTYEIFERWEEVSKINSNIPYPSELIEKQEWQEISNFYSNHEAEINKEFPGLSEYIFEDKIGDENKTVEMLFGNKDN